MFRWMKKWLIFFYIWEFFYYRVICWYLVFFKGGWVCLCYYFRVLIWSFGYLVIVIRSINVCIVKWNLYVIIIWRVIFLFIVRRSCLFVVIVSNVLDVFMILNGMGSYILVKSCMFVLSVIGNLLGEMFWWDIVKE